MLPKRIVTSNERGFRRRLLISSLFLPPFMDVPSEKLLNEKNAVSEPEKKAENSSRTIIIGI